MAKVSARCRRRYCAKLKLPDAGIAANDDNCACLNNYLDNSSVFSYKAYRYNRIIKVVELGRDRAATCHLFLNASLTSRLEAKGISLGLFAFF